MFDLMPFRRNEDVFERMLKTFNDMFDTNALTPFNGNANSFRTDITEKEDAYLVEAELPGFSKEDITIDVNNNYLTIRAKRDQMEESKDEKNKVIRQERRYGEFVRQFYVDNIKEDEISATLDNGVLKINIPKKTKEGSSGKRIEIQ
ncbi:MAG: Hsp20/alpha crystallin family protein [Heyndrickxia faecalis]|jgi:HSP20 family protein|uniref:18 kDa heat shock protein n=5 Tax=Heyndrickxia TaxID=2837504 RepID=A0A5J4JCE1_9BACI|nr:MULTISPECIES: Hsp20/alpha crystallin family protein [Heyndrickxia]AEH53830.1 heat shock protein Hsp20 [Heyndrickxia coagulans 2-6]AEP01912.1 heat shock protein Hsp20 [Heyndrickxia coagulans 36D1]APB36502.1 heat-shock protein Hsp20 [Heyndrickxia coagulans]AVD56518.1 Hsp20/alpha crystallin family protein [Heyndrickxia coagulans]AWP37382.1 Hsp20/alpha crystallin family protein [Heyndrickxia coagulans]